MNLNLIRDDLDKILYNTFHVKIYNQTAKNFSSNAQPTIITDNQLYAELWFELENQLKDNQR